MPLSRVQVRGYKLEASKKKITHNKKNWVLVLVLAFITIRNMKNNRQDWGWVGMRLNEFIIHEHGNKNEK